MKLTSYFAEQKIKLIKTWFLVLSFIGLGGCSTLIGSSLLDLQIRMSTTFAITSNLVPARSIGYLIGGIVSGFLDRWFERDLILFAANFVAGSCIAIAPWFTSFYPVFTFILLSGLSQGVFDIVCNTYILLIWKGNSQLSNYVQILHGSFGIGSLLTPLVTQPFLLPLGESTTNGTQSEDAILGNYTPGDVKVQWPFLFVSFTLFISSAGFLVFHFKTKSQNKNTQLTEETGFDENEPTRWKKYIGISMLSFLANLSFGINVLIGSLVPAFVVKSDLHMDKQTGASLVTVFWIVLTIQKILFIVTSNFMSDKYLLAFSYICQTASVLVLIPHAAYNHLCIWIGMILLAIGFSPSFTVALSRLQNYFILSNSLASIIFINGSIGEAIHPWIASKLMNLKPVTFVYYLGILSAIQILTCISIPFAFKKLFKTEMKLENVLRTTSIRSWTR